MDTLAPPEGYSAGNSDLHYSNRLAPGGGEADRISILWTREIAVYQAYPAPLPLTPPDLTIGENIHFYFNHGKYLLGKGITYTQAFKKKL